MEARVIGADEAEDAQVRALVVIFNTWAEADLAQLVEDHAMLTAQLLPRRPVLPSGLPRIDATEGWRFMRAVTCACGRPHRHSGNCRGWTGRPERAVRADGSRGGAAPRPR